MADELPEMANLRIEGEDLAPPAPPGPADINEHNDDA